VVTESQSIRGLLARGTEQWRGTDDDSVLLGPPCSLHDLQRSRHNKSGAPFSSKAEISFIPTAVPKHCVVLDIPRKVLYG